MACRVENLWWLAIVLWVKRDKKGMVKEVGCVYPRTAGEAPNVANEPKLLRPAADWSHKTCEWRPVFAAYKRPAFQDELDAQAKKHNVPTAEVHEDSNVRLDQKGPETKRYCLLVSVFLAIKRFQVAWRSSELLSLLCKAECDSLSRQPLSVHYRQEKLCRLQICMQAEYRTTSVC